VSNRKFKIGAVWLLSFGLSGCSDQKSDTDRLKQEMPTFISYAAEGELYVNYLARGESTRAFRSQHAEYLRKNVLDSLKEFDQKQPDPTNQRDFQAVHDSLQAIADALDQVASGELDTLRLRSRLATARKTLESVDAKP
jgi:uncharacterized membrane protein